MEFTFLTDQIRARINGFFGYEAVERVAFEPYYGNKNNEITPSPPPVVLSEADSKQLENTVGKIENEELREALKNLGKSVLESRSK